MENGIIFSDLGNLCAPSENISDKRLNDKWHAFPYETDEISGTFLLAPKSSKVKDVVLTPRLSGWYKIFVGLYTFCNCPSDIQLKLTGDKAFKRVTPCLERFYAEHCIEDVFWRCAEMDGKEITIGKHFSEGYLANSALAWIRFVPMSDQEIKKYLDDKARNDTKRLYAANDMHNMLCFTDTNDGITWEGVIEEHLDSDIEWLAIENMSHLNAGALDELPDNYAFTEGHLYSSIYHLKHNYNEGIYSDLVAYGQEKGLKMCISKRITMWGMEYPEDFRAFENPFAEAHPEYRCIDRDGDVTEFLSFAYEEVQNYIIDAFVEIAKTGADAVQPLFSRGWPYILFEEPFLQRFSQSYDIDARKLPLDDERIIKVKCEMMTEFMRRLRRRLDEVRKEKPIELHAKVLFSLYDNLLVGLDVETWAKEGIIDRIISDERRIREILDDSVFEDASHETLNIEKYNKFVRTSKNRTIRYDYDYICPPFPDSKGVLKGPASQQQRIAEFMELERKYGTTVYIEIMPRAMECSEIKRRALEIYDAGCEHIALWDTETRICRKSEWSMWKRIGHKDELTAFNDGEGEFYQKVRLLRLGNKNVRSYMGAWSG